MKTRSLFFLALFAAVTVSAQEKHLKNIKQLTFGGDNAEAYFSFDGKNLTFQCNNPACGAWNATRFLKLNIGK